MKKKKELIIILGSLLVVVLSVTLAYFATEIFGSGKEISVESTDLKIIFTSGTGTITGTGTAPGWTSEVNTFTVKNQSNDTYKYNIVIKDLVNTFVTKDFLLYKITSTDGGYSMTNFTDVPKSSAATDTILAYSVEIAKGTTHTYSVEFKYASSEEDQSDDMGKKLSGTLFIEKGTEDPDGIYAEGTLGWQIMNDNTNREIRTDFTTTFTTTNTGTLYKSTESVIGSSVKDVYYFAGDAKNNWVKFGKFQADKVVYRGYRSTTSSWYKEYPTMDACTSASSYNINCTEFKRWWNKGDDIYWRIIRTNHDGSIRLLYSGTSPDTTDGYISTSAFENSEASSPASAGYMYGIGKTLASNRTNKIDSEIKIYIDNWYNTYLSSYTKYISAEAVYCNDRELASDSTYSTSSSFYYASYTRLNAGNPTYYCLNSKDAFSGSNSEAKLTYPVGLMSTDEITYAGGGDTSLTSPYAWYYLNSAGGSITGSIGWWLLSPRNWSSDVTFLWYVGGSGNPGSFSRSDAYTGYGVRPVISIKKDALWSSGDGSPENPYEIVYN